MRNKKVLRLCLCVSQWIVPDRSEGNFATDHDQRHAVGSFSGRVVAFVASVSIHGQARRSVSRQLEARSRDHQAEPEGLQDLLRRSALNS